MMKVTSATIAIALCLAAVASAAPTRHSATRRYGSGYSSDGYNSGYNSGYSSGGVGPIPTTGGIVFQTAVKLQGVNAAQFTPAVQQKFKESVVAGLVHMPLIKAANAPLVASDVYINSFANSARRGAGLSVTFSIYTGSTSPAMVSSAMASLVNHLDDTSATGFLAIMNAACSALGFVITDMSITQQPIITASPVTPAESSSSDNTTLIIVIVVVAIVVAIAAYFVCQNKAHKPSDGVTIYRDNASGNEVLGKKGQGVPSMGGNPMDDKTVQI